jgi:hypothetical protein
VDNNRGYEDISKPGNGIIWKSKDWSFEILIQYDPINWKISSFYPYFK